tara:strand:- start:209 stop:1732 length:1524 start_codon:yes stop_codon:yes gene_type:complete
MKIITNEQSKKIDQAVIDNYRISELELIRTVGKKLGIECIRILKNYQNPNILVFSGTGNNGLDSLVVAEMLKKENFEVSIFLIKKRKDPNFNTLCKNCIDRNIPIISNIDILSRNIPEFIIDGILGTGLKGNVRLDLVKIIKLLNKISSKIISIDIPSGLDSDSGLIKGECIKADYTITVDSPKIGMLVRHGKIFSGKIIAVEISYLKKAHELLDGLEWRTFEESDLKKKLKKPRIDINKNQSGRVLVVGGSTGMSGAIILTTLAVLRSGSGMAICALPASLNNTFEMNVLEGISIPLQDDQSGYLKLKHYDIIMEKTEWADSVVIGPGIGRNIETQSLIKKLVLNIKKPLIVDADGLSCFEGNAKDLFQRKFPMVITPHLGELSILLNISVDKLISQFPQIMENFMKRFSHTALVKQVPACTFSETCAFLNTTGNPGLATAGSGDVLAGMLGSFISQGFNLSISTRMAAFIHGKSSDLLIDKLGYRGQLASDLLRLIPSVISNYEN